MKLPRATCRRRQKEQITKKEKGKDYNLLPSPVKTAQIPLSHSYYIFSSLPVNENIYIKTSSKYLLFTIDLILLKTSSAE